MILSFKKYSFGLALIFSFFLASGVNDTLINRLKFGIERQTGTMRISVGGDLEIGKPTYWLYYGFDDPNIKSLTYRDSAFKILKSTRLRLVDDDSEKKAGDFDGVCWYKLYFKTDSASVGKTHYILCNQLGASEIYLDGYLLKTLGAIDNKGRTIESVHSDDEEITFFLSDTLTHCLSIRYSYSDYKSFSERFGRTAIGPTLAFLNAEGYEGARLVQDITTNLCNMLGAFFLALFLIHLMIYLFYREKNFNLYYSLFLLFVSLSFLEFYFVGFIQDPATYLWISEIDSIFFPACCFFLVTLLNKLLNVKRTKHYIFFTIMFVYVVVDILFSIGLAQLVTVSIVFYTYFNTLAHSIVGIRRKVPSSKFLGWGILSFTLTFIIGIIIALIMGSSRAEETTVLLFLASDVIIAVLSIPLSMSGYLAYDFARTNKSLSDQLKTNEELSKEKEAILSNQNKVLETQVQERTQEIAAQNKILEHQKKEIMDSINYAKRIQQALLPDLGLVKHSLPNSFILYIPKDIVSGDFYFFSNLTSNSTSEKELSNRNTNASSGVLIAAADCTGHGVPGALMSMIVHEKLEQAIKLSTEPSEILKSLNKQVKDALKQSQNENSSRDGCDICFCRIQGNKLSFAGAFRPLYVYRKQGEFTEIKATKTAIAGITPHEQAFAQSELNTDELKAVYLFSDGFADQFGGEKSKKLTTKKFKELLNKVVDLPVEEQKERLEDFFKNWRGNVEQIDDVLVIGIKF
jgi:serine phosphatase RsbU (regulator of sigma subunit)